MTSNNEFESLSEVELQSMLVASWTRMSAIQKRFWKAVQIQPEKWIQQPYGDIDGFWVVGLIGLTAIWYNDIEEGFNVSKYTTYGVLDEYACQQDELEWTIDRLLFLTITGEKNDYKLGFFADQ